MTSPSPSPSPTRTIALCSCEDTMALDTEAVKRGCPAASITTARHLCRSELAVFAKLAAAGDLTVACTQEAPVFEDVAAERGLGARLTFANVRETAGWSTEGAASGPKMAALLAAATVATPPAKAHALTSEGVALVYGEGPAALLLAERLKDRLDLTVLLSDVGDITPPRRAEVPIRKGRIVRLSGHLGQFEIVIDGYAEPAASSRAQFVFGPGRNGAVSKADVVIDVSGKPALVAAPDLRHGYLRADPRDMLALERIAAKAADLVGTFDAPRYIAFDAGLCAHSRSRIVGCRRCLDLCPAGAIAPNGNTVVIDPALCGGCGQCAAACPTGAAAYDLPPADVLITRIRAAILAYRASGGRSAVLMLHGEEHGDALIDAAARFGNGLPATVIPLGLNEIGQVGVEVVAAALAYGASAVALLTRTKPRHDETGVHRMIELSRTITAGLGYPLAAVSLIEADDPDQLGDALRALSPAAGTKPAAPPVAAASFLPAGTKREIMALAFRELARVAPVPAERIALPEGAPFGRVAVDTKGCTLCLSCVAVCPTHALGDAKDRPLLKFDESLCVQCGLCAATCPEKVITLEPRLDFGAFGAPAVVIKEEEPFCCVSCGTPFGVKSTIEKVAARLEGRHWMFTGPNAARLDLIRMCDTCRVEAVTNKGINPYAGPDRPRAKTSEDYFREREAAARPTDAAEREADMLKRIDKGEA